MAASESQHEPNDVPSVAVERRIRWDAMAAIIAVLVGLLALCVSGYTAYIQRQQVRAQVWPYLLMGQNYAKNDYEFVAINKGTGPVIVQTVQVFADGKPIPDAKALNRLFDFKATGLFGNDTLSNRVIAPGDKIHWFRFDDAADFDTFKADWAKFRVEAQVCYSSTLGDTWLVVYQPGQSGFPRPVPVANCPSVPTSQQFHD